MKTPFENKIDEIHKWITSQNWQGKDHLTLPEAADYLGVSKSYLYKLTSQREIPFYRPGTKLIYFLKKELDDWILSKKEVTKSELFNSIPFISR